MDRLEALFGQFLTEMALLNHHAQERDKAAEERNCLAEERNRRAEDRNQAAEERLGRFEQEMREFKNEMAEFKHEMREFKDEMAEFKDEMREFKDEMAEFKDEMAEFKNEMTEFKDESLQARRDMNKQWGNLANKMGTIIEDILAPNLRRLAREHFRFGTIQAFMMRCTRCQVGHPEIESEFDTLAVGTGAVILGEAKSTPSVAYADEFASKVTTFFDFFPEYRGWRLIPIFGSWAIPDRVVERLTQHGIYAMRMGEDTME
ncbi:MAG: hypothetical protein NTY19_09035, partial [Planctomycetota bacterium]|nr:hypothetical protein [Planctomycetota bacterium]